MSTAPLANPDPAEAYEDVYDALSKAYWDATDVDSKDRIHGAMEAIAEIITAYDEEDLANNTTLFLQLKPKINATNAALKSIKDDIAKITRNINTVTEVTAAVSKVLSVMAA
jgi:hypothetical protein